MTTSWPAHWPPHARTIARLICAAIAAAVDHDADELAHAVDDLAVVPHGQAEVLHAAIIRTLLEETHPGGLAGDDVSALVVDITAAHPDWSETIDRTALVIVLLGSLGVDVDPAFLDGDGDNQDREDVAELPRLTPGESARHATLIVHRLLTILDAEAPPYVTKALDEIARAETIEMP